MSNSSPSTTRWSPSENPSTSTWTLPSRAACGIDAGIPRSPSHTVSRAIAAKRANNRGRIDHLAIIRQPSTVIHARQLASLITSRSHAATFSPQCSANTPVT